MPKGNHNPPNQWKKGQSGNPAGPKSLIKILKEKLDERVIPRGKTKSEALMEKLLDMALGGNLKAVQEILNRIEGANKQVIQMEADVTTTEKIDYSKLTTEELETLQELVSKTNQ